MARVIWLVLDSFGVGGDEGAAAFGDAGADTLGHIAAQERLSLPHMTALGLGELYRHIHGAYPPIEDIRPPMAGSFYGAAREASDAKDTLSGHWEMAGVQMDVAMTYFPDTCPTFPSEMIQEILSRSDIDGILGDRHASGLEVIETLGEAHIATGKPIFYTSADSVLQIAAHETHFGLERLYRLCEIAREVCNAYGVGRVIARPFLGEERGHFARSKNRKDYAMRPSGTSVFELAVAQGREVVGIGKIHDIFGGHGISKKVPAYGLEGLMDTTLAEMETLPDGGILMTNFVDFDMEWGHRRDTEGYAKGLAYFDGRVPELLEKLQEGDMLLLTADHGCDPTWPGSDHTRELVPVFGMNLDREIGGIGIRDGFADMAQGVAEHLELELEGAFGKGF